MQNLTQNQCVVSGENNGQIETEFNCRRRPNQQGFAN
jgi:hypothetical protein